LHSFPCARSDASTGSAVNTSPVPRCARSCMLILRETLYSDMFLWNNDFSKKSWQNLCRSWLLKTVFSLDLPANVVSTSNNRLGQGSRKQG